MRNFLAIGVAAIWITASEFLRNEFLFKSYWINHFHSMGLEFVTLPINGILWTLWSFGLAYLIFRLISKFSFLETMLLAWLPSFAMMWITTYNLQVLPLGLLIFAIPLSLFEVFLAMVIIRQLSKKDT
jgi:hypothetical protein